MGNEMRKLSVCFAGDAGEISRRRTAADAAYFSEPFDEGLGHSYCYIPHESLENPQPVSAAQTPAFRTISGAAISANVSTPLSTDPFISTSLDKASAFESSSLFSSTPLQPIPINSHDQTIKSGPIPRNSGPGSGPIDRGFLSGPIERSFISGPLDSTRPDSNKRALVRNLKKTVYKSFWSFHKEMNSDISNKDRERNNGVSISVSGTSSSTVTSNNLSSEMSFPDDNDDVVGDASFATAGQNLQWAQGKAGEDRVHIVISEDQGWAFVGIYDGFNGPDATDFLLSNLYTNVEKELKGLLWSDQSCESTLIDKPSLLTEKLRNVGADGDQTEKVLKGLSEALRKTEASYLEIADMMLVDNPELALMGSCVLVMVMMGDDVYMMNVGDSRAVLAKRADADCEIGKSNEEESFDRCREYDDELSDSSCCQLTMDHSTSVKEEVRRIRNAHCDDAFAVRNGRVKGSLKVTRAFGAGFLKHPKWNNALLEMFRIEYIGTSPYVTCSPSLCHHRLESRDKFLMLSSDGLYQYFTNEEAVCEVEIFMSTFPEGDPAQHLVKELLFRAAKKAGMDFHQLLDIPQGDRRRYHDDVSIIIISFEGSMWRSSV